MKDPKEEREECDSRIGTVLENYNTEDGSSGFQFGRLSSPRRKRPACPSNPRHSVWSRGTLWFCPECRKNVNALGRFRANTYPVAVVNEAVEMVASGSTIRKAALKIGLQTGDIPSRSSVLQWVHSCGIRKRRRKMAGYSDQTREASPLPEKDVMEMCKELYGGSLAVMVQFLRDRISVPDSCIDWRTRARCKADMAVAEGILARADKLGRAKHGGPNSGSSEGPRAREVMKMVVIKT